MLFRGRKMMQEQDANVESTYTSIQMAHNKCLKTRILNIDHRLFIAQRALAGSYFSVESSNISFFIFRVNTQQSDNAMVMHVTRCAVYTVHKALMMPFCSSLLLTNIFNHKCPSETKQNGKYI